ncbi:hypothetical protein [Bifidobacterium mongoliense]|uniref:Uncharacterized protein n=1 Tax=Bifidobacterium mongoliense DSM 21395 TaxID=1437603 RepID=A0A087BZX0_9BIFI|nr:hypothetical protein [Bifidobacterium mongoliense]KFI76570.1 hypothetical protein BMON_1168 [Bifidobacterium mongoliense DSM 21395]
MSLIEWIHVIVMAVLAVLIIISLFWWVFALANGIFAMGPFIGLMAGIAVSGILSDREHTK